MKRLGVKGLAAAALVAACVVPAASAKAPAAKLSVLPLPKSALGSAKSLPLQLDSGVITNGDAAGHSLAGATTKTFTKLGRISGYALDYGAGASGGSGVTEVWTSVDQYKTIAGAKKGLAFWKKDDAKITQLNQGGFVVTSKSLKVPAVGGARFASFATYKAANIVPLDQVDEQFTEGRYELDVTVSAGSASLAKKLAPQLAKKLDARIKQAVAGKLHARPVKLPAKPKAGAPSGGPDLSTLALKATDLSGTATVKSQGYFVDSAAVSDYSVLMLPAGPFDILDQEVEWYSTPNEASFAGDFATAQLMRAGGSQVDLGGVGDGAQGVVANGSGGGFGQVVLSAGHLTEFISVGSQTSVQTSDMQSTAHTAAGYIDDAGLGG